MWATFPALSHVGAEYATTSKLWDNASITNETNWFPSASKYASQTEHCLCPFVPATPHAAGTSATHSPNECSLPVAAITNDSNETSSFCSLKHLCPIFRLT